MDSSIKNGTLKGWIEYESEPENYANYNVWYYYYLNGQAPDLDGNYVYLQNAVTGSVNLFPIYFILIAVLGAGLILVYILKKRKTMIR